MAKPGIVRLAVNLAPSVATALVRVQTARAITITEAIRRAIAVWVLLEDAVQDGKRVYVHDEIDGTRQELTLL